MLGVVTAAFTLVAAPVIARAGPLRDDFDLCTSPRWNRGLGRAVSEILPETGAVRLPGRLTQAFVVSTLCDSQPFWVLILVPFVLTMAVAGLLVLLLARVGVPGPWPQLGAALWLLEPLGTESSLWAVQFNIPLGLLLVLLSLLAFHHGRALWGAAAALIAYGFVEQVIFALPVAAWLVSRRQDRPRAALWAGGSSLAVLALYSLWTGYSERTNAAIIDRVLAPFRDLGWYVEYPVVGLGLHSIPLAIGWAFPVSLLVVAGLAIAGIRFGPGVFRAGPLGAVPWRNPRHVMVAAALVLLVNVPLLTTLPHPSSPRTFTPTWLVLCAVAAIVGSRVRWRHARLAGGVTGALIGGMLLSLALSSWVRIRTADFTEASSRWLAQHIPEGETVLICDVPRTVVRPAPAGDFAVHELIHPWAAEAAVRYYTGRELIIRRGPLAPSPCTPTGDVDKVLRFGALPSSPHSLDSRLSDDVSAGAGLGSRRTSSQGSGRPERRATW